MVAKAVALPAAGSASLTIGLGLDGGVVVAAVNLVSRAVLPHILFIGTVRWGPTSHEMAGRPRSGRGQGVRLDRWVKTDGINSNSRALFYWETSQNTSSF